MPRVAGEHGVPAAVIGRTGGRRLTIEDMLDIEPRASSVRSGRQTHEAKAKRAAWSPWRARAASRRGWRSSRSTRCSTAARRAPASVPPTARACSNLTGMGLVSQVFHERDLAKLGGYLAIGHTRYSTTGGSRAENAQPIVVELRPGQPGAGPQRQPGQRRRDARGRSSAWASRPRTSTDSELIAHLIAQAPGDDWLTRMRARAADAQRARSAWRC